MLYLEFAQLPRSQKITLAVIKAKQRLKNFTFVSGSTWTRVTSHYVSNVIGATYSFDPVTSTLMLTSSVNPNTLDIIVEYSFFFSDFPVNQDVEYEPRLIDIGALKLELDTENTGIAIESDSSIKLENTDGFFDPIFDSLVWENQECLFYSWSPLIPWTEKKLIYRGFISTKSFTDKYISFVIKDSFVKLREVIPFIGSRLIYGKAKNLDCLSLYPVGAGFTLSGLLSGRNDRDLLFGTIYGTVGTSTITGVGTSFTTQLAVSDKIRVIDGLIEYSYTVNAIGSNTSLTISGTISVTFSGVIGRNASILNNIITGVSTNFLFDLSPNDKLTVGGVNYTVATLSAGSNSITITEQVKTAFASLSGTNLPSINHRYYNRAWNVSGHLLADHSTTIDVVYSQRVFSVFDISHITYNDIISVFGSYYSVTRISGNVITLNQSALVTLSGGVIVYKPSVQKVSLGDTTFVPNRDYNEINMSDECSIVFNEFAEFNAALEVVSGMSFSFVVGSRVITSLSNSIDLTTVFSPRDWIKAYSGSTVVWYEISEVATTTLTVMTAYSEAYSYVGPALYKHPTYIGDSDKVLVDCMGKKSASVWLKTASDAVNDICTQLSMSNIDPVSFANAKLDAPYCLSVVYPTSLGGKLPTARDMILAISQSVFGSLYSNSDFNIAYSILGADRDIVITTIADDDIISFTTSTKNQITKNVTATYRQERGNSLFQSYTFSNSNISGISTDLAIALSLYDDADAQIITQRYAFLRSSSQMTVTLKGKLNLISKSLNDRVYLNLTRLFKRFGASGNIKIGLVNLISKDSTTVDLQVNDVGNLFSRVGSIAPNTASDFSTASADEISRYTFIVDNNTETPDASSDIALGANLIG
jgi:hypothetical protein